MKRYNGFTLIELMVTVLLSAIIMLALGGVLADAHRGYNAMYNRINSPVVQDAYRARRAFESRIRKASSGGCTITASSALVYYFSGPDLDDVDRYAEFTINNGTLTLSEGDFNPSGPTYTKTSSMVVANNVIATNSTFKQGGDDENSPCIQMVLHLNNGKEDIVVTCSSIRHNR